MKKPPKAEPPKPKRPAKAPTQPLGERAGAGAAEDTPAAPDAPSKPHFGKGQPAHYCGKPGRSGAPKGNRNAMRHGLMAGSLPRDAKYIETRLNIFRRTLENTILLAKTEITLHDAACVQTCIRWERHAMLAQRWLVKMQDQLKPEQRLTFSREIARASAERDRAIGALRLDRDTKDSILDVLYTRALPAPTMEEAADDEST